MGKGGYISIPLVMNKSKAAKYVGVSDETFMKMAIQAEIYPLPFEGLRPVYSRIELDSIHERIRKASADRNSSKLAALKSAVK